MYHRIGGLLLLAVLVLFSCKKNDCSSDVKSLDTEELYVVVGWPITLKTEYISTSITNKWSGPNSWKMTTLEGISEIPVVYEADFSRTGSYSVESYTYGKCLAQTKKINVHVIDPPHSPCSMNSNSINISSPFTYQSSYTQVISHISNNHFVLEASNGNQNMMLTFPNTLEPKPGIHSLHQGIITSQGVAYVLDSGKFYVQKINNQLVVSFCEAVFYNPNDLATDVLVSGEITLP